MQINDFRFMKRGVIQDVLDVADSHLLAPVHLTLTKQKKRALLMLHGFSSSPAVYRYMLPELNHYDTFIVPVLPGHGESIDAFSQVTYQDWLNFTEETYLALTKTYEQVDVLGLSLGGVLAYRLSLKHPLSHLYLLAPALILRLPMKPVSWLVSLLKNLGFHTLKNKAGNLYQTPYSELAYTQLPLHALEQLFILLKETPHTPPTCPTDVFLGCHDETVNSEAIAAMWHGAENVKLHWLSHSSHVLPLDSDMSEICRIINQ